ncbi:hypothetical protein DVA86_01835 [Streptomyces armeniacus]|uniref:Pyridoxamine 5'-phosphate oxidase family protein n=1 Tax=Streptomyces armeniacus TaxID=83291 RepID=A0A345XIV6_9ACTN|nr:hypothetical protein [Streptomyces armeniacus]AXK31572.1 hypothetical protein DVA86_01835 [Streptomyces armeniacus]
MTAQQPPHEPTDLADRALVEEAAKKSGLLWVRGPEGPSRALWHVWHEGAVCLVGDGPQEQPLDGLGLTDGGAATVTARSKDKGGRLVAWPVRVVELTPGGERWTAAVDELKGKRLNAPDADTIADRWARECRVLRLETAGAPGERPGAMPDASHAAAPRPTAATTRRPAPAGLPRLLFRRKGRTPR